MRLLVWTERLLVVAGVAMLLWCAAVVVDAIIAQRNARAAFAATLSERAEIRSARHNATVVAPRPATIGTGTPLAALSIPRIELSAMVLHGSDAQTLRRGPGHLENSALPGEPGNVVIAGHRDSFFWPLQNIHIGDDVFLDTRDGPSHYRVTSVRVVNPHEVSVLAPTANAVLTLITCYPFSMVGPAPDRFVVRAVRVDLPTTAAVETEAQLPQESRADAPVSATAGHPSDVMTPAEVFDDDTLVRQTIAGYLRLQGAQLATTTAAHLTDSHVFTCDVRIDGGQAFADCHAAVDPISDAEPRERVFTLERSNDMWAIRSIALK